MSATQCWKGARSLGAALCSLLVFCFWTNLLSCTLTCVEQNQDRCHYSEVFRAPGLFLEVVWLSFFLSNFLYGYLCDSIIGLVTGVVSEILMPSIWVDSLCWYFNLSEIEESFLVKLHATSPNHSFPASVVAFLKVKYSQLPLTCMAKETFPQSPWLMESRSCSM